MIKIEFTEVYGWQAAIRGMRNPMNSWHLSDSYWRERPQHHFDEYVVGENDLKLMKKLVAAGSDHSKFMRFINVTCDITAPLYWWKEYDTYKVGTVANSCSTMHKIHAKEFELNDFSHDRLSGLAFEQCLSDIVCKLNQARFWFVNTNEKKHWWNMIQLLPTSYNQKRTVQLNYAVLRNMYHARKSHKLDEWRTFCEWVESLPYSELITN